VVSLPSPALVEAVRAALAGASPGVDPTALDEFVSRLDAAYFTQEAPEDVAAHVCMASQLTAARPARLAVTPRPEGRYDVAVVAFDYFAEFSILCGLLAAHRLEVESGHIHTFSASGADAAPAPSGRPRARRPSGAPSRKIVDVFRVVPKDGRAPDQAALELELLELLDIVTDGRTEEARERLNRRLVETLAESVARDATPANAEALAPLSITFDNQASTPWTVMDVGGRDTPGFLYALANALAQREVYVHQVRIESVGREARDRFWIAHRDGTRIEAAAEQQTLQAAVALIKQFTHLLPSAPDPARALRTFDQFLDRAMAEGPEALRVLGSPEGLRELARLLGSSAFLWEDFLRMQFEHLLPVLGEWRTRKLLGRAALRRELQERVGAGATPEERKHLLNQFKDEQVLLIDMKHLMDPELTLEGFSQALTDLAEGVVEQALAMAYSRLVEAHGRPLDAFGRECPVAVLGLGKFGGREMGYASDIELLVVYGGNGHTEGTGSENGCFFEDLVRETVDAISAREEGIFHVDLRLRPHGNKGPLASPLEAVRAYYRTDGEAAPFERQALIKLRRVAGDDALGRAVEAHRDSFVWSGAPWDRENALHLRERQARELVPAGRFSVKYSPGALVEVEYSAQYLQIEHGHAHPELRTPSTLEALDRLRSIGLLGENEHQDLRQAYVFWRRVADGLRMVRGNARDLLLPEDGSEEQGFLARRLGYAGAGWHEAGQALGSDVARHRDRVRAFFAARFRAAVQRSRPSRSTSSKIR
jgi:[glutamine synthetase] adenylyltransferase / [glutamine synthetase]-adenylyl-L-tyrosine phosphorylase